MRYAILMVCAGLVLITGAAGQPRSAGFPSTQPASGRGTSKPADEQTATEERLRADDRQVYAALARTVPEATFADEPFEHVLVGLMETQKVNLHVDWGDLQDSGVPRDRPVSMQVRDLPAWRVLRLALDQVGSEVRLGYEVRDGVLLVATAEKLDRDHVVRVYPVGDLLYAMAQRLQRLRAADAEQEAAGAASSALAKATDPAYRERTAAQRVPGSRPAAVVREVDEALIEAAQERLDSLIEDTVSPDSWRRNGGEGTVSFYNNALTVRQSRRVHRELERMLLDLRAAGGAEPESRPRP